MKKITRHRTAQMLVATGTAASAEVFELSPFEVNITQDLGCLARGVSKLNRVRSVWNSCRARDR